MLTGNRVELLLCHTVEVYLQKGNYLPFVKCLLLVSQNTQFCRYKTNIFMTTKHVNSSRAWHTGLWIVQVLVGGMFLAIGFMKSTTPIEELARIVPLAGDIPWLVRFIGVSEFAGGLGLLLPAALRIRPKLTVLAALALGLVMVLAVLYHVVRGEFSAIGTSLTLGILTAVIAWGRQYKAPILARTATTRSTA